MDTQIDKNNSFSGYYLFIPLLLAAFLYIVGITSTDLWAPDETRYAEVAREMIERGNYIQPYLNGRPYTEKPPLFFWLVAAGAKLFGDVNPFILRLPSVLSALGTLALLIVFIREFFDKKKAFLAAIILCVSPEFFLMATFGLIDMLLTFLLTTSLVSFYRWYARGKYGYLIVFYLCLALATLAKGPVGMLLPLLVVLCFLMFRKEWGKIREMRIYVGLPIAIVIVLAWYIPATQQSAGYDIGPMAKRQIIGRLFHPSNHAVSIFYWPFYHFQSLVQGTLPWIILIPLAVIVAYRCRRSAQLFFLLCWAFAIFGFFTIVAAKRSLYILPMYPAIAALIAMWILNSNSTISLKLVKVMTTSMGILFLIVAVIAPVYLNREFQGVTFQYSLKIIIPMAIACVVTILPGILGKTRMSILGMLVVSMLIFYTTISTVVFPKVNEYKSARSICSVYLNASDSNSEIAIFGNARPEYVFYTHSIIKTLGNSEDLKNFFNSNKKRFCFIKARQYNKILYNPDFPVYVVARKCVSIQDMMLLCNQDISLEGKNDRHLLSKESSREAYGLRFAPIRG